MAHRFQTLIGEYRRRDGLSLEGLSQRISVSKGTLSKYVNGSLPYPSDLLEKTCGVFRLTPTQKQELLTAYEDFWQHKEIERGKTPSHGDALDIPQRKVSVPVQIPKAVSEHFVGREEEIERIRQSLHPGKTVTLIGPGGIGKTELAISAVESLHASCELETRFPDGVLFYSFYGKGKEKSERAYEHIIKSYGGSLQGALKETALDILSNRCALIILDGTECADDLRSVIEIVGRRCAVLLTTQRLHHVHGAHIPIQPLSIEQVTRILQSYIGEEAANPHAVKNIYTLVGGLTLAFELIGRHLRSKAGEESLDDYVRWLVAQPLEALSYGNNRRDSVAILIERSVSYVDKRAQGVLSLFGVLSLDEVPLPVLTAGSSWKETAIRQPLEQLVDYGLVTVHNNLYKVRHRLIHSYVRDHLFVSDDAIVRMATHYAKLIHYREGKKRYSYSTLFKLHPHVIEILSACAKRKLWDVAADLAHVIDASIAPNCQWFDRKTALALGLVAAKERQAHQEEYRWLHELTAFLGNKHDAKITIDLSTKLVLTYLGQK